MPVIETFMIWGLPVLQSLVATGISEVALRNLYADDGSDNDAFRKIMREAFVDAVKRVRKDASDKMQKKYAVDEFRYYQKALIDELVKMEPVDRKTYIEKDLHQTFKEEVMKRQDALQHISMALAQEAVQHQKEYARIIDDMHHLLAVANEKLDKLLENLHGQALLAGLTPSSIITKEEDYTIYIPELHSDRGKLVEDIANFVRAKKCVLLYGGVKEGKTVTAALLTRQIKDYKVLWLDFAQENRLNLEAILTQFEAEDKILFVLDGVRYDNDALYEKLCKVVAKAKGDNWLFLINCYEKLSELLMAVCPLPTEYALPPLTLEEVGEMIPDDKKATYQEFIYTLFEGQPLLTHMACVYLQEHGWRQSSEDMGKLFTFPKGTPIEKQVRRMAQKMIKDEDYALMNRLLLLDKTFTPADCEELANVSPIISNPRQKLDSLCGTWVKEEDGLYSLSPLLRKTMAIDLLPQERKDCCYMIAGKIIHQSGGITPNEALKALSMLITAQSSAEAAGFYTMILYKLDDADLLEHEMSAIWRGIWLDIPLPEWMTVEDKAMVRLTQLLLLVVKYHIESSYIVEDLDQLISQMDNKSQMKSAAVRVMSGYLILNNKADKLHEYRKLAVSLPSIPGASDFKVNDMLLLALDNTKNIAELLEWAKMYKDSGEPEVELLPDGVIMKVNQLYDETPEEDRLSMIGGLTEKAHENGYSILATVACARWIDALSAVKDVDGARKVMTRFETLAATSLGNILMNYSYGLCLYNNGDTDEGYDYIEKSCDIEKVQLASAVLLNACASLAECRAKRGDRQGALEILLQITSHPDFAVCYSEFEKGSAYGALSYAYWMVGERVEAVRNLLKVECVIWDNKEKRDDNYKNLSLRFSVLALQLASEATGRKLGDKYAAADYGLFFKIAPSLLGEYKPARNFTVLYALYHLSELVLKDEETSLMIIDHMFAMQRTDAVELASLLSALMQAYPLFVLHDREDMLEYAVLTALSGKQTTEEGKIISFESLVLVNAIATLVMKRTLLLAEGKESDDDPLFQMIEKAVRLLPEHQVTDLIAMQLAGDNPDYKVLIDLHHWGIVATYHLKDITPSMALNALYVMVKTLLAPNNFPSAISFSDAFVRSFAYLLVKEHQNRFKLELKDFSQYFRHADGKHGMEYLRTFMQGLYFKLKTEPTLDKDILKFIGE